jgi:hypothetical protein
LLDYIPKKQALKTRDLERNISYDKKLFNLKVFLSFFYFCFSFKILIDFDLKKGRGDTDHIDLSLPSHGVKIQES